MAKELLKDLTEKELRDKLKDCQEEMRNLKVQTVMGQLENKKRKWVVRKKIAQINTFLNEYKLGIRKTGIEEKKKDVREKKQIR